METSTVTDVMGLPLVADLKLEIEEHGATTRVGENLQSAIDVLEYQAARIADLEAQLAERVKVEDVLDAASEYMKTQYGIGALSHPADRDRILSALEASLRETNIIQTIKDRKAIYDEKVKKHSIFAEESITFHEMYRHTAEAFDILLDEIVTKIGDDPTLNTEQEWGG